MKAIFHRIEALHCLILSLFPSPLLIPCTSSRDHHVLERSADQLGLNPYLSVSTFKQLNAHNAHNAAMSSNHCARAVSPVRRLDSLTNPPYGSSMSLKSKPPQICCGHDAHAERHWPRCTARKCSVSGAVMSSEASLPKTMFLSYSRIARSMMAARRSV
jgi:hypothetical protein